MKKYLYSNGVSLIELLVIIAIIGIFATIGTQGYRSIITGADTMKAGTELVQHLNDIRFRAFSENKHYKVQIVNGDNNTIIEVYEPDDDNSKWKDIDLVRRCAWQFNENDDVEEECINTFCNSAIEPSLKVVPDKIINKININKCINNDCTETTDGADDPVQICFLFDGTIALPQNDPDLIEGTDNNILYLKSESTSNDNFSLNKIHKTGYVE
jgi:Tfp pilus assembly protein PilE